jgi:hypothetical protein
MEPRDSDDELDDLFGGGASSKEGPQAVLLKGVMPVIDRPITLVRLTRIVAGRSPSGTHVHAR